MPALNTQSIVFPELNKLSLDELQFLVQNEDRQQEFLDELPYIKEQNRILDEQILQTEELAEANLAKQEQLLNLRKEIDGRIEEVAKLAFENERLHVIYQNYSDKYSPRNIQVCAKLFNKHFYSDNLNGCLNYLTNEEFNQLFRKNF